MRHGKRFNHLGRMASHRKAMLANMGASLIIHKRIFTTVAKAKALRTFVEPIITKAKVNSTHSRRTVFAYFQEKTPVKILFDEIAPKVASRPGGYTRIIRVGKRLGDHADRCLIELVDYNEVYGSGMLEKKARRTRRGTKNKSAVSTEIKQDSPEGVQGGSTKETAKADLEA